MTEPPDARGPLLPEVFTEERPTRRGGFLRAIVGLLTVVGVGLLALPWVLSHTSLADRVAAGVAAELPDGTTVGRPVLSWIQPAGVRNVGYARSGVSVHAEQVLLDRPFWTYLWERQPPARVSLANVDVRFDLDEFGQDDPAPSAANPDQQNGEADAPSAIAELPSINIERLKVTVTGSTLVRPVAATFDSFSIQPKNGELIAAGTGRLSAEPTVSHSQPSEIGKAFIAATLGETAELAAVEVDAEDLDGAALSSLFGDSPLLAGTVDCKVELDFAEDGSAARVGLRSDDLAIAVTENPIRLSELRSIAEVTVDADGSLIQIGTAKFASGELTGQLRGTWPLATAEPAMDDVDRVAEGSVLEVETKPAIVGELSVREELLQALGLSASISVPVVHLKNLRCEPDDAETARLRGRVHWPSAAGYGLVSRDGFADCEATPSSLQLNMTQGPVATGFVRGRYEIDWTGTPTLRFAGGPMLENVVLTEALCRDWLKYVSPAVANGTEVSGQASLAMAPFTMPLDGRPAACEGTLTIAQAQLRPGPLLRSVGDRVQLVRSLLRDEPNATPQRRLPENFVQVPPQAVRFVGDASGVRHDRFLLAIGPLGVSTEAFVGYDERLAGRLTVIPPRRDNPERPVLAQLANQPLSFEIGGTIAKPQLKQGAVRDMGRELLRGTTRGLLQQLLD